MIAGCATPQTNSGFEPPMRLGAATSPISSSVLVPPGYGLVYVSGTVPDVVDPSAPRGSAARYGDTEAQTRSVLRKIGNELAAHRLGLGNVVMMRVFLVAPPGQQRMDFAGMMTAYRESFGTAAQPEQAGAIDDAGGGPGRSRLAGRDRGDRRVRPAEREEIIPTGDRR